MGLLNRNSRRANSVRNVSLDPLGLFCFPNKICPRNFCKPVLLEVRLCLRGSVEQNQSTGALLGWTKCRFQQQKQIFITALIFNKVVPMVSQMIKAIAAV